MLLTKRSFKLLAGAGTWLVLALCTVSPAALGEGPLVVAHTRDYPPLNFMRDGQLVGIEVDNAREIGKALGREVKTVVLPFAELVPALNSGKVDVVMAGMSVTPEREDDVLFVEPFMEVGQMAIILADKAVKFANPRAVYSAGIRVGVEPNTTGEQFVRERVGTARILHYDNAEAAFQALRNDEIDMYVHDAPTSWQLAIDRNNQDMLSLFRPLTRENLAWAVRKDNTLLAARLNAVKGELERTGRLRAIQNYWIPVKVQVR
jgi:polar amino acid transport system substrate-binding protein